MLKDGTKLPMNDILDISGEIFAMMDYSRFILETAQSPYI